ncbi:MAG: cell division protein ZapA [Clostridia bacterium]
MKEKIELEVYGIRCNLVTNESEEYMKSLAKTVENTVKNMQTSSTDIALAVTAISFCHDNNSLKKEIENLRLKLAEKDDEILNLTKEIKNKNGVKKYSENPLRFNPSPDKKLVNFYEKNEE